MDAIRAFVPILAYPVALTSWILGFRRRIVAHNLKTMGWPENPGLHFSLCWRAARDLSGFALGSKPEPSLHRRSRRHLEQMRHGPSLLLTAHFHDWERLGSDLRTLGVPLLAAAMPLRNAWANRLLARWRRRWDLTVISENVARRALRHLRGDGCFALLWDQHAPGSESRGHFHGVPVRMNPLPGFLLEHVACPVYFGVLLPEGAMRLIPLSRGGMAPNARVERRYHRVLETLVRRHPEYWYGFLHARFKDATAYPGR